MRTPLHPASPKVASVSLTAPGVSRRSRLNTPDPFSPRVHFPSCARFLFKTRFNANTMLTKTGTNQRYKNSLRPDSAFIDENNLVLKSCSEITKARKRTPKAKPPKMSRIVALRTLTFVIRCQAPNDMTSPIERPIMTGNVYNIGLVCGILWPFPSANPLSVVSSPSLGLFSEKISSSQRLFLASAAIDREPFVSVPPRGALKSTPKYPLKG